jgi:hypothetical protein
MASTFKTAARAALLAGAALVALDGGGARSRRRSRS